MEKLHNDITQLIQFHITEDKLSVAEVVLLLEMIRSDLVSQVTAQSYTKKPIEKIVPIPKE